MQTIYKNQLYKLGFSHKEATVYLALNQIGPSPASTIGRFTNIKRSYTYDILEKLLEKNLITSYKQGKYTYFAIDDINRIYYQEKEKLDLALTITKELKQIQNTRNPIQVFFSKGQQGYIEIFNEILRIKPKELLAWMNIDNFYKVLTPEYVNNWIEARIAKGIKVRVLMQDSLQGREFQSKDTICKRKTILIPKEFTFNSTCFLYEGFITFFDTTSDITGIRIEHTDIYEMQKNIFEMNWEKYSSNK